MRKGRFDLNDTPRPVAALVLDQEQFAVLDGAIGHVDDRVLTLLQVRLGAVLLDPEGHMAGRQRRELGQRAIWFSYRADRFGLLSSSRKLSGDSGHSLAGCRN